MKIGRISTVAAAAASLVIAVGTVIALAGLRYVD
jgi:hypothetical protein